MTQSERAGSAWHMLALVSLVAAACAQEGPEAAHEARARAGQLSSAWTQLPDPPLSGRGASLVATVGDTIIVSGGRDWLCPPGADCELPSTPPYADGAAYDLSIGRWKAIADAPVGLHGARPAVVDRDVYVLSQCGSGPTCPAGHALLRYRSDDDEWDLLPGPDEGGYYKLVAVRDGVVAYRGSDERGTGPDYHFRSGEDHWVALPEDPLPPSYDRFIVEYDGRLMLFGTPIARGTSKTKLAAVYDPETKAWQELAESGTQGYQVWRADDRLYLNPHFGRAGGGIYEPDRDAWRPLPDPPYHDLAGVIGQDGATYEYASGWVLDARTDDWLEIAARPESEEVYDEVVAEAPDRGLVVFGGQRWVGGRGQLLNRMWLWSPPP